MFLQHPNSALLVILDLYKKEWREYVCLPGGDITRKYEP
jgi:hypothetical protein